jgi:hypothetical protein
MSDALRALVDADNQRPGPSDGVRAGVFAALGVSIGVIPAGVAITANAAAAASAGGTAAAGATAAAGTTTATTAVGAAAAAPVALLAKGPLVGVGLGAVLGASLTAYVVTGPASRPPRPAPAAVTEHAAPSRRVPSPPPAPPALAPAEAVATPAAPAPAPRRAKAAVEAKAAPAAPSSAEAMPAPAGTTTGVLAAEQALLDPARAALARGDGAAALARLDAHERRFPAGSLSQEREAMAIRALVLAGDRDGATARAARFRSRYPGSLLGPVIDATLRARP